MRTFFLLLFLALTSFSSAQTKYFIYFKDKGISHSQSFSKASSYFQTAEKELSARAIERRKKVMGDDYVTYEDIPINEKYISQIEKSGIKIANKLKWFNAVSCYLTIDEYNLVKSLPFVNKIEEVKVISYKNPETKDLSDEQNRSLNKTKYNLDYGASLTQAELSQIPVVHDLGINGSGVLIGLLDTGFRWKVTASIQSTNVVAEHDFIQNDDNTANQSGDTSNQDSHGTSVLSLIGGNSPGNLIGPAYGSSFLLAKTEYVPSETHAEEDNYAAALEWMEGQGVDITSSSLGYSLFDNTTFSYTYADMNGNTSIVAKAANLAFDRGVITLTAAGNEGNSWGVGKGGLSSPGDAFNILTVGAVTSQNDVASFSSRGPTSDGRIKPELAAMGVSVVHAVAGSTSFASGNGTSYATPITAGIAALLKSAFPHLTNQQVRQIMIESGDNVITPNNERGYGLISAKRAVEFPNLSYENNVYTLHKIFTDKSVKPQTVKINYKVNNGDYQTSEMNYDGSLYYTFAVPLLNDGDMVSFYIGYENATLAIRTPAIGDYKFKYGSLITENIITDIPDNSLPTEFSLSQNYPNPFNPGTRISYTLQDSGYTTLKVYDFLGREVVTLVNEFKQPGKYSVKFSNNSLQLSSGIYFYILTVGDYSSTRKMVLLK
ncbi:MAG: S8 family peptidase [Ignavibacteriales bacterium]|nr:S8 family peptidase [Ignavibacteriales bacterium]